MVNRIQKLENNINLLKAQYDQYFVGILKTSPSRLADEVAREIRAMATTKAPNTALQFRLQQVIARYNTYLNFWQRNLRDLEEGKNVRRRDSDMALARARNGIFEISSAQTDRVLVESLYRKLTQEYRDLGSKQVPDLPRVREMVKQQTDSIKEKYNCSSVEYRVVVEDGKVKIKANPIMGEE
jgi:hypothetical protein